MKEVSPGPLQELSNRIFGVYFIHFRYIIVGKQQKYFVILPNEKSLGRSLGVKLYKIEEMF